MTLASMTSSGPSTPRTSRTCLTGPMRTSEVEDQPAPTPAPASTTKQEIKEEDAPMEVDTSSAAKKPRVSSDEDVPIEGSSLEEVSSGQPGPSSRPSKVEGSPMGEGSARLPKPSTRQPKVESSSMEEESLRRRQWSLQQRRLRKRFAGGEFGAIQPRLCCPRPTSFWKRIQMRCLRREDWTLSQPMRSLWTRLRLPMRFPSSRTVQSSATSELRNWTWRPNRLSSFSARRGMEVRMAVSITTIAVMTR